jgi:hypothetical protein
LVFFVVRFWAFIGKGVLGPICAGGLVGVASPVFFFGPAAASQGLSLRAAEGGINPNGRTPTHPIRDLSREFKNTIKILLQKVHVENFSQKNRQNSRSVFPRFFFVLSGFRVFLSDESSKTLQKSFTKKSRGKVFTKKSTKNPKPIFSRFFYYVYGRFWVGE